MRISRSSHFKKRLKKKLSKKPSLKNKISKQVKLLIQDIKHPSLKVHKLAGKRVKEYSFWIEGNLRITFLKSKNEIIFTDIITHDEY